MKRLILMIQFLTRIPLNVELKVAENDFAKGTIYFPVVGLIVGLINALVYVLLSKISTETIAIVILTLVNIMVTGAFHLDGLADTCDGIFSARQKERMLEIMKDSRIGTNGAVAIFFDLAIRIVLLYTISKAHILSAIIISSVISRMMIVLLMYSSTYARAEGGLGQLFIGKVTRNSAIISTIIGSGICVLFAGYNTPWIIVSIVLFTMIYKKYIISKIDGMTGDTLGAANELCEILVLFLVVILERYILL